MFSAIKINLSKFTLAEKGLGTARLILYFNNILRK